jgi:hypothetical protein
MPPKVFFRGDERDQTVIKRDGFAIHGEAAAIVKRMGGLLKYLIATFHPPSAPKGVNSNDVQRWIVTGRARDRPTVSTSLDQGCGGYDTSFIYRIEFANLYDLPLTPGSPAFTMLGLTQYSAHDRVLRLLVDNMILTNSRIVAVDLGIGTREVSFLTDIPAANVTQYKPKGMNFMSMATVQPAPGRSGRIAAARLGPWQK